MSALIMCVDVGLANIGAAVMNPSNSQPVALEHFQTERSDKKIRWRHSDDRARRVAECARFYAGVIRKYEIKRCLAELPIGGAPNSAAATDLAYASAALVAVLEVFDAAAEWYDPREVKKAATGRPGAPKRAVMTAIEALYPTVLLTFPTIGRREHVCDALAVWLAGRHGLLVRTATP